MKIVASLLPVLMLCSAGLTAQSQIRKIVDLSIPPVSAFKNYCSRCHGDEGSAYGKSFADMKDDSLRSIVENMMFGPGGLNPDSTEVEAMVSYNKFLKNKTPFAVALNSKSFIDGKDKFIEFETTPGSKLEVIDKEVAVENTGNIWRLNFDPLKIKNIKISVTKNKTISLLEFPAEMWTH